MKHTIKSGKEVIEDFFSDIINIDGADRQIVEMLTKLYAQGKLTDTNIQKKLEDINNAAMKPFKIHDHDKT